MLLRLRFQALYQASLGLCRQSHTDYIHYNIEPLCYIPVSVILPINSRKDLPIMWSFRLLHYHRFHMDRILPRIW